MQHSNGSLEIRPCHQVPMRSQRYKSIQIKFVRGLFFLAYYSTSFLLSLVWRNCGSKCLQKKEQLSISSPGHSSEHKARMSSKPARLLRPGRHLSSLCPHQRRRGRRTLSIMDWRSNSRSCHWPFPLSSRIGHLYSGLLLRLVLFCR